MKVVFADKLHPSAARKLRTLGVEVVERPELGADVLPLALAEEMPDVLVVRSTGDILSVDLATPAS